MKGDAWGRWRASPGPARCGRSRGRWRRRGPGRCAGSGRRAGSRWRPWCGRRAIRGARPGLRGAGRRGRSPARRDLLQALAEETELELVGLAVEAREGGRSCRGSPSTTRARRRPAQHHQLHPVGADEEGDEVEAPGETAAAGPCGFEPRFESRPRVVGQAVARILRSRQQGSQALHQPAGGRRGRPARSATDRRGHRSSPLVIRWLMKSLGPRTAS